MPRPHQRCCVYTSCNAPACVFVLQQLPKAGRQRGEERLVWFALNCPQHHQLRRVHTCLLSHTGSCYSSGTHCYKAGTTWSPSLSLSQPFRFNHSDSTAARQAACNNTQASRQMTDATPTTHTALPLSLSPQCWPCCCNSGCCCWLATCSVRILLIAAAIS